MKKTCILTGALAALLALCLLTGCGAKTAGSGAPGIAPAGTVITLSGSGASISGGGASAQGGVVTVSAGGSYRVTGTLDEGRLLVDAGKESDVVLILDGAALHCSTGSPLAVLSAKTATLTLAAGSENSLSDGADYRFAQGEDEPDAALYSKADLILGGTGKLTVSARYKHAIKGKDAVTVEDGVYVLESVEDALRGKDALTVSGGLLTVSAGDDALHSDGPLLLSGGEVRIQKSVEGLEGQSVTVTGGTHYVTASDDAVNASSDIASSGTRGAVDPDCFILVSGGFLWLDAEGDGLDSNGDLLLEGGTVIVNGPTRGDNSALDSSGKCALSGGVLAAADSGGMTQSPDAASGQPSFHIYFAQNQPAGTLINLSDSQGASILSFAPEKPFRSLILSSPALRVDEGYVLSSGGSCAGEALRGYYGSADYAGGSELGTLVLGDTVTTLMSDGSALSLRGSGSFAPRAGRNGARPPEGETRPDGTARPEGATRPKDATRPDSGRGSQGGRGAASGGQATQTA